jgi:bifunctional enzyme CysN/CysC
LTSASIPLGQGAPRLRVLTCGSVDDGKSTLIGRLLHDCEQVPADVLETVKGLSPLGSQGPEGIDFSFLLDGLDVEREQGITIDVAYRTFTLGARICQFADCPGHPQYTRNMVTAASNCEAAIVLVDGRYGVLEQTRRHLRICALMGVRAIAVAINKMDLCDWSREVFEAIQQSVLELTDSLGFDQVSIIALSALTGDNVVKPVQSAQWYSGGTLLAWLEEVQPPETSAAKTRLPIQYVSRIDADKRMYLGRLLSGHIAIGASLVVGKDKTTAQIIQILDAGKDVHSAQAGASVAIGLDRHLDLSRGDILSDEVGHADYASQFAADIIWFSPSAMVPGRTYAFKGPGPWVQGSVSRLKYKVGLETGAEIAANVLEMNDIGCVNISVSQPILCDAYLDNRLTGGLLIVDIQTHETLGVCLIKHPLRRSSFITMEDAAIDGEARALRNQHRPLVVWLTGLSGSGKSTLAKLAEKILWEMHFSTTILDGDNMRSGLCNDLGFTEVDRVENVRRTAEVAKLMADAGLIVFCALISPFERDRSMARSIIGEERFVEVFVDASIETCTQRDPKGLYAKANAGLIPNFTGVSSPYQRPIAPELAIDTGQLNRQEATAAICDYVIDAVRVKVT